MTEQEQADEARARELLRGLHGYDLAMPDEGCQCICHAFPEHNRLQDALEANRYHVEKVKQAEAELATARAGQLAAQGTAKLALASMRQAEKAEAEADRQLEQAEADLAAARAEIVRLRELERPVNIALADVLAERQRQDVKWGEQNHDPFCYLTILIEEVGEFAQAALHARFGGHAKDNMMKEAVHVAAVSLALVEALYRQKWSWGAHALTGGS